MQRNNISLTNWTEALVQVYEYVEEEKAQPEYSTITTVLGWFMCNEGFSTDDLAANLGLPTNEASAIISGTRIITEEDALKLSVIFHTTKEFWLNYNKGDSI